MDRHLSPASLFFLSLQLISLPHLMCFANVIYPNTALTPSSTSKWTSPSGAFSMGFFSLIPNTYYVGIWYTSLPSDQSIIWTANRNHSVPANSALHFMNDGRLVLIANSSTGSQTVWETMSLENVVSNASQAELLDDGNFVMRDITSNVIWQSYDHPTDTLMPNQNLTFSKNLSLVAWVSTTDPSPSPKYGLVFGRTAGPLGHIRLLYQSVSEYWSEPPFGVNDTLFDTTFTMDRNGTISLINGDGKLIWVNTSCDGAVPTNSIKKLQLSADGDLRVLTWSSTSKTWNTLWRALYLQCDVFDTCGENSICDKDENRASVSGGGCPLPETQLEQKICSCPESFTRNGSMCVPPTSLNCSRYMTTMQQTSLGIPGQAASASSITLQDCKDRCLNACNCTAVTYANSSSSCWLYNTDILNGVKYSINLDTSFIKTIALGGNSRGNASLPSYAIVLIVIAVALLVLLSGAALFIRHQIRSRHPRMREVFFELDELGGPKRFSLEDLYMATGGFDEKSKLGAGGYGTVYKGTFITPHGKLDVAIKKLDHSERHGYVEDQGRDFLAEIETLGCIKHLNVVNLIGFCAEGDDRLLVYELVSNGSLSRHIFSDSPILSWDLRFGIAVDAATGIEYLHTHCPKKIVHRDIKPDNILLDEDFKAKVADFGVAQIMAPERAHLTNNTVRGTPAFMSPECWHVGALLTEKADVYSYGVVLLELVSGKKVTKNQHEQEKDEEEAGGGAEDDDRLQPLMGTEKSTRKRRVLSLEYALEVMEARGWESLIDERLEEEYNKEDAERLVRSVFWCLQGDPKNRPSMEELLLVIKGHMKVPPPSLDGLFDVPLSQYHMPTSSGSSASVLLPEHVSQGR